MKNANLPAMPTQEVHLDAYHGLTKREMFAMAAMQGLLASLTADDYLIPCELARSAVLDADALLAELERTK